MVNAFMALNRWFIYLLRYLFLHFIQSFIDLFIYLFIILFQLESCLNIILLPLKKNPIFLGRTLFEVWTAWNLDYKYNWIVTNIKLTVMSKYSWNTAIKPNHSLAFPVYFILFQWNHKTVFYLLPEQKRLLWDALTCFRPMVLNCSNLLKSDDLNV